MVAWFFILQHVTVSSGLKGKDKNFCCKSRRWHDRWYSSGSLRVNFPASHLFSGASILQTYSVAYTWNVLEKKTTKKLDQEGYSVLAQSFHVVVARVSGSWEPLPNPNSGSCSVQKNNSSAVPTYFQHEILCTTSTELSAYGTINSSQNEISPAATMHLVYKPDHFSHQRTALT